MYIDRTTVVTDKGILCGKCLKKRKKVIGEEIIGSDYRLTLRCRDCKMVTIITPYDAQLLDINFNPYQR